MPYGKSPYSGENPAEGITGFAEEARERFAQADELSALLAAVAQSDQRDYFLLSLLTGARRSNVQAMAWRDLDLAGAVWRIGKTKNGTPQNVPLSPEAVIVLNVRRERAGTSPFVFPGTGKTGLLVELKKAWATILRTASLLRLLDALNLDEAARTQAEALQAEGFAKAEKRYHAQAAATYIDPADFAMTDLRIHDLRLPGDHWEEPDTTRLTRPPRSMCASTSTRCASR